MFKRVTVSFRTRQELLEGLDRICGELKCSRSSLIETILREFLSDRGGSILQHGSRGVSKGAEQHPHAVESGNGVVYLSLAGVRLGLPKNLRFQVLFDEKNSAFQLDLAPGQLTVTDYRLSHPQNSARDFNDTNTPIRTEKKDGTDKHPIGEC
jgi:hypothetical protein